MGCTSGKAQKCKPDKTKLITSKAIKMANCLPEKKRKGEKYNQYQTLCWGHRVETANS